MTRKENFEPYEGPAGGWGSAYSVVNILTRQRAAGALPLLARQNKTGGFACVSCAWAKPKDAHPFEFCENGAKATAWEATPLKADPDFFARHPIRELLGWSDFDLENVGRLTHPMRWDAASDCYVPVSWDEAFAHIGQELRALRANPDSVVFYASGRASLETSYMYQLLARLYGTNNLPDSSNMCHESTSVALPKSIGVPVGTVRLDDFALTDAIFFFGQNVATNSPRMLHDLQAASERGVPIVVFNPLRERGLEAFKNPQSPSEMLSARSTRIASQYHQVNIGGDIAAIQGICKAVIALDDAAIAQGLPRVVDAAFIAEHTSGFEDFAASTRQADWQVLEQRAGISRGAMEAAAQVYVQSKSTMAIYGMGLTQHEAGVENVHMVTNLLLLRGNIGRPGTGVCPVRGHSNVQGQRTVGISEKPELVPLDTLARQFAFSPPRHEGLTTVKVCEGVIDRQVKAFIGLGGNFVRAVPDTSRIEPAWRHLRLTVQIATKLNRSHLVHGEVAYLLPCLGRTERHVDGSDQVVSMEDSTAMIHGSRGTHAPASEHLLSEPVIVGRLAKATVPEVGRVPWDAWMADYAQVRNAIAQTWPDTFHDFNKRMDTPGGFPRPNAARERRWQTENGKANFIAPTSLEADADIAPTPHDVLRLMTLRSNDQFNTTVYGYDDRFRGIQGTRHVVLMSRNDIDRLDLREGEEVTLETAVDDGVVRTVRGMRVTAYDIPDGNCAAYYPECNALLPLWHVAKGSHVPAAKAIPVRLRREHTASGAAVSRGGDVHVRSSRI